MIPRDVLRSYASQQPFRPFQIHTAGGRTYQIRHPEMIVIRSNAALIFSSATEDAWDMVSMMLMESVNFLDAPVS